MEKQKFPEDQFQEQIHENHEISRTTGNPPKNDGREESTPLQADQSQPSHQFQQAIKQSSSQEDREFALKVKQFQWERLKTIISALGLGATAIAAIGLWVNYQQGVERLVTERFSKAIEQLGSENMSVRIGGVYALERIAKDSPKDHWTVMEVLTAFVRERSPNPILEKETKSSNINDPIVLISTDVQAALTVIVRRDTSQDPDEKDEKYLDLRKTNLAGANLAGAKLVGANLSETDLRKANFVRTNLQRVNLSKSSLKNTEFCNSNLDQAVLRGADVQKASFSSGVCNSSGYLISYKELFSLEIMSMNQADLEGANLQNAKLNGIDLREANLRQANLQDAKIGEGHASGGVFRLTDMDGVSLEKANLQGAILDGVLLDRANFNGANLQNANLKKAYIKNPYKLAPVQVKAAKNWQQASYNDEFRKQLGLPAKSKSLGKK